MPFSAVADAQKDAEGALLDAKSMFERAPLPELPLSIDVEGDWAGSALAFKNEGGDLAVVAMNPHEESREFKFKHAGAGFGVSLEPRSFNTFQVPGGGGASGKP